MSSNQSPKKSKSSFPDFNRTQLETLRILWDAGEPLKPSDIEERFAWPIENATLRSVLRVLMDRGEVKRKKNGKAYLYFASREKSNALSELMGGLAEIFSSGSRAGLIAQLLHEESLSPEEVKELQKIANQRERKNPS